MRLLRNLILLLIVLALLAALALAFVPAQFAIDRFGDRLGPLKLNEVSGTIWSGQAGQTLLRNENLGTLRWSLSPIALLSARADADLDLSGGPYVGRSSVSITRDRVIRIANLDITMSARKIEPLLDIPALVFRGEVQVTLNAAEVRGGVPTALDGRAVWKNAAVAGSAEAQFGDLISDFSSKPGGGFEGTISDSGGPLQAQGSYSASLAGYEAVVDLRARDGNPQVLEALQYIGQPQPDGSSKLEVRGRILDLM
jgi:general secretion pathway protein N